MPLAALPAYVERIGVYRDINAAVLRMSPQALVRMLVDELVRAGAAREQDGVLLAA
jgi:hypothetical protein